MTTLDDLKRAIDAATNSVHQDDWNDHADSPGEYILALTRDAWRMAFKWRNQERFEMITKLQTPSMAEYQEGMRLIREKLS